MKSSSNKAPSMLALLKDRNFSLLFAGNFVSRIGSTFYNFAVGWFILTLTASPLMMGLYIALGGIVELIASPLAGVFIDRLNKVRILYVTDFIRGLTVLIGGALIFSVQSDSQLILLLYGVTVILALNNALFFPANSTLIPEIVADQQLTQANAFFSLINSFQTIIGILLAGLLYGLLGIELIFIINGISFILSAISEMFIRTHYEKPTSTQKPSFRHDFKEGVRYIRDKTGLLPFVTAVLFLNFAFAPFFANALPYLYNLALNQEALQLAIANIIFSSGMVVGGLLVGALGVKITVANSMKRGLVLTIFMGFWLSVIMILAVNTRFSYMAFSIIFLPSLFILAISNMFVNIPFGTGLARAIQPEVRGRVFAIVNTLTAGLIPISYLLAGLVLEYSTLSVLLIAICLFSLVPLLTILHHRKVNLLLSSL